MTPRLQLKRSAGWFAAGLEVQQAATLVSDGAFKSFVWLCLHAERASGIFHSSPADLARALRKTEADIARHIQELSEAGICRLLQPHRIEIRDRFWPYERARSKSTAEDATVYVAAVRRMFLSQSCVRSSFSAADEQLAADWSRRGVPLQQVERAILLGTVRKYVALINRNGGSPITTLHYFRDLIEQANQMEASPDYWKYLEHRSRDFEFRWRRMRSVRLSRATDQTETK